MPDAIAAAVTRVAQAAATLRNGATRLISIDPEGAGCWHVDADAMAVLDAALEAWTNAGEAEIQFIRRPASARVRSFTRTLRLFREVLRVRSELKESLFLLEVDPAHRSGRGRWWRANRAGYTDLIANAGLYAAGETDEMDCRARSVADVLAELDEPGTNLLALVDRHPRMLAARAAIDAQPDRCDTPFCALVADHGDNHEDDRGPRWPGPPRLDASLDKIVF